MIVLSEISRLGAPTMVPKKGSWFVVEDASITQYFTTNALGSPL
jgi:hypothetical protein